MTKLALYFLYLQETFWVVVCIFHIESQWKCVFIYMLTQAQRITLTGVCVDLSLGHTFKSVISDGLFNSSPTSGLFS